MQLRSVCFFLSASVLYVSIFLSAIYIKLNHAKSQNWVVSKSRNRRFIQNFTFKLIFLENSFGGAKLKKQYLKKFNF